jgi:hypothetical protein
MTRYAKARDANHAEIRDTLRRVPGVRVLDTGSLGGGHPDLLVRVRGKVLWLEVKDGSLVPSARQLSEAEERFRAFVGDGYHVVTSKAEALRLVLGVIS